MLNNRLFTYVARLVCLGGSLLITPLAGGAALNNSPIPEVQASDGTLYKTSISTLQTVSIYITLGIASEDVGKIGALYVVTISDNRWFMLDHNGNWLNWAYPDMQQLVPAVLERNLSAQEKLTIANGLQGFKGVGDVYVGYKVQGADYQYSMDAISFTSYTQRTNNTGTKACANEDQVGLTCPVADYPGQDAEYAVNQNKYTKIDAKGELITDPTALWSCVKDNTSGLWWEVKKDSTQSDLQNQDNVYSWYNPDNSNNGGSYGVINGGSCSGSPRCDTLSYVEAINAMGLCGKKDWRLPNLQELLSLVDNSRFAPSIDQNYFPNTPLYDYWSSTPRAIGSGDAWSVYFYYGSVNYGSDKKNRYRVRVVRDGR